ncbi:MAG TPA: hypothetical protein VIK91_19805 [Nannocystis sp.]
MRNVLSILATIAFFVGVVAPEAHGAYPKDPWWFPKDPKHPKKPKEPLRRQSEGDCPPPFKLKEVDYKTKRFDKDNDDCVCVKWVPGKGNTGDGRVVKDDK